MRLHSFDANLLKSQWDMIIIGAGINGTGIARDAAMRGLKVLVLEKEDVACATSAWNTRLIHGGLRYLEYFEFYLVRESLAERERLLKNAPHLVKPLPLVVPFYKQNQRGPLILRLGMILYDVLSYDKSLDHHHIYSANQVYERVGGLNPQGLSGAAMYYDCQVEFAERLSVENIISAIEHGATFINYAKVNRFILEGNVVKGVEFMDELENKTYQVYAPLVINVGGPWVDEVLKGLGKPIKRMIGGTKGSHIVVEKFPGAPKMAIYFEARSDGRPMFIIPWTGRMLIGTTDFHYNGDLDRVVMDDDEMKYLISETNQVIPTANLTPEKVLYSYSGVRPLPYTGDKKAGAVTRRHIIYDHAPDIEGLVSIIGGKLTTFRNLAQQCVDMALKKLKKPYIACSTMKTPLPGAGEGNFVAFRKKFLETSGLDAAVAEHLLSIYGVKAQEIQKLVKTDQRLAQQLSATDPMIAAEVIYAMQQEGAETIQDVLLRRSLSAYNNQVGLDLVEQAAKVGAEFAGWQQARIEEEVNAYKNYIQRFRPAAYRKNLD
ncbi:MAG: glycerol-3-phosphate dehydrogenase [Anaerolineales bacterium]